MQEVSHEMGNLVSNGTFASSGDGDLPKGWEAVIPNPHLAPEFQAMKGADGGSALGAAGNGRETCFGYVRQRVRLEPCKTYRLRVRFRCSGLGDVNLHLLHGVFAETVAFNDGIFDYVRSGKEVIGENRFPGPSVACDADVRLYFRYRWIAATIDLSRKYSPGWHGGPMLAAPGGRRCRQTLIRPIEEEIAKEARRWWQLTGCKNTQ